MKYFDQEDLARSVYLCALCVLPGTDYAYGLTEDNAWY